MKSDGGALSQELSKRCGEDEFWECLEVLERAFIPMRALEPRAQVTWLNELLLRLREDETPAGLLAIVEAELRRALYDRKFARKQARLRKDTRKLYRFVVYCRKAGFEKTARILGRRIDFIREALRRMKATGKIDVGMPKFGKMIKMIRAESERLEVLIVAAKQKWRRA